MSQQLDAKFAKLLVKLSERITEVARNNRINTDAIDVLRDQHRLRMEGQDRTIQEIMNHIQHDYSITKAVREENDQREAQQTLRDQNNVQSLVNLRDSTAKGFDQV